MKNLYRTLIVAGLGLVLSACAGMQLEKAKMATPGGSAFDSGLYKGYVVLSSGEYAEGDYRDSDAFANRAMVAAGSKVVAPEAIKSRDLPSDKIGQLSEARKRLVTSLNQGARSKVPAAAARAQIGFDCWMQEQEENFQPRHIAACRNSFFAAMADVETAMKPAKAMAMKKKVMKRPVKAIVDGVYVVFFDFDDAAVNAAGQATINKAVYDYHLTKPGKVFLSGHADRAGSAKYNTALSERRLRSVLKALSGIGVPGGRIETEAFGESKPLIISGDGKREPKNRRVEIIFE